MTENDAHVNAENEGTSASLPPRRDDAPFNTAFRLRNECGFNILPLKPRSKRPLFEWKPFQSRPATDEELEVWNDRCPTANWAVLCGRTSGCVVLDADDAEAVRWIERNMPPTPYRVRSARGVHFYYKYDESQAQAVAGLDFKSMGVNVDVQKEGRYVVAPGSIHPDTGAPYVLEVAEAMGWEDVPFIVDPFARAAQAAVSLEGVRASYSPVGKGGRHNLVLSRVGALIRQGLPPSAVLREALQINRDLCVPPLAEAEIRSIVDSTFASDTRNRLLHPQAAGAPQGPQNVPAASAADFIADTSDPLAENPWTEEILHPGGTLERICDYIEASAVRTERAFALAGAITVMGAVLGQRIRTETELLTNVYCMAVGGSASGKDAPKRGAIRLMTKAAPGLFAGSDVSSEVAILSHLNSAQGHRACLVLDEIGMLLKACKNPNSSRVNVVKLLTELYSGYGTTYVKLYADKKYDMAISWQSLSILGLSVAEELFGAMRDGEAINGWLARNLIFEVRGAPRPKRRRVDGAPPRELVDELAALWAIPGHERAVVTDESGAVVTEPSPAAPDTVRMDPEADEYHWSQDALADAEAARCEREGNQTGSVLWARAAEHAWKLALIHAASRAGADVVRDWIRIGDVRWAWALVNTHHRRLVARVSSAIFRTEFEEILQRVRAAIQRYVRNEKSRSRKAGHAEKPGAPYSYIVRELRGVPPKMLDEALKAMTLARELFVISWKASDRSTRELTLYCLGRERETDDAA